jgi:hypothetical protein
MPISEFILLALCVRDRLQAGTESWHCSKHPNHHSRAHHRRASMRRSLAGMSWLETGNYFPAGAMAACCAVKTFGKGAVERPCLAVGFCPDRAPF